MDLLISPALAQEVPSPLLVTPAGFFPESESHFPGPGVKVTGEGNYEPLWVCFPFFVY